MNRRQFAATAAGIAASSALPQTAESGDDRKQVWFCYDPECGIDFYDTEAEALKAAQDCIDEYCDELWDESVHNVTVGIVTHTPHQKSVVTKEMLNEDGEHNGRYYSGPADYWCDYEMERIV